MRQTAPAQPIELPKFIIGETSAKFKRLAFAKACCGLYASVVDLLHLSLTEPQIIEQNE
jgi:hypothetical protein